MSLANDFPQFQFAGAADSFLETCMGDHLSEQLLSRKITCISIVPLFASNCGLGIGEDNKFRVVIDESLSSREQVEKLGHEVAHTFHYNLTHTPPKNILTDNHREEVEKFCDAFALRWVEKNGAEDLARRFKDDSNLITHFNIHH